MPKKFLLLIAASLFAGAAVAADAKGGYEKKGETAGMDPLPGMAGQVMKPKAAPHPTGTKPVAAAAPGAPEPVKGMAARDETAGMDPKKAEGQKVVAKEKKSEKKPEKKKEVEAKK